MDPTGPCAIKRRSSALARGFTAGFLCAAAALAGAPPAAAQVTVTIVAPDLGEGRETLEALLASEASAFSARLGSFVEENLDRPLFMRGFSGASASADLLPGRLEARGGLVLSAGMAAAAWSADDYRTTIDRLSALGKDDDLEAGAAVRPLFLQAALPLGFILPGLDAGLWAGYLSARGADRGGESWTAGLSAGFDFLRGGSGRFIAFEGFRVAAAAGWSRADADLTVRPGPVYQDVPLDPDGAGPLQPQTVTLLVDPAVRAGLRTSAFAARIEAGAGASLLRTFGLRAALGVAASATESSIYLSSDDEVVVQGYLSGLVERNGRVAIGGGTRPETRVLVVPYAALIPSFRVGPFALALQAAWNFREGLSAGVFLEYRP